MTRTEGESGPDAGPGTPRPEGSSSGPAFRAALPADAATLRHLAVHPSRWRTGLARAAVGLAVEAIRAGGRRPHLWCLADNHRARGLYAHLGWEATGVAQPAVWPPHPVELQFVLPDSTRG